MDKITFATKNALKGLSKITTGTMFRVGLAFGIATITASWIFPFSMFDRLVVITFAILVLVFEGFNSTLERLLDLLFPKYNKDVEVIKDMLAGTVLIGAVGAILVGVLILIRIFQVV